VSYTVGWRLLVTAWGRLPARLCRAVHGRLIVGGALGGDTVRLLEHAPEEVLCPPCHGLHSQRLGSALGLHRWGWQRACSSSSCPCRGHSGAWDEKSTKGDGANPIVDGTKLGLGRLVPAQTDRGVELV
jgi:hypothetical protein